MGVLDLVVRCEERTLFVLERMCKKMVISKIGDPTKFWRTECIQQ